jgi:primosomal protein N' (replication factor Y)
MQVYKVLLPILIDEPFDYKSAVPLAVGSLVRVPLRKTTEIGVVWGVGDNEVDISKIKEVAEVLDVPPLPAKLLKLLEFVSEYNLAPLGTVLKLALSAKFIKKAYAGKEQKINFTHVELSNEQKSTAAKLRESVKAHKFETFLLDGVTGSGKTEVYFEAIEEAINQGKQVLVMLPEIALSHQWLMRFEKRFGITPAVWHSDRTEKERRESWLDVASGNAPLVVGARSALFLPFKNLGLVVVDEEHDASYKQEEGVIYHARDMAVARAKFEEVPAVLVSATPSVESVNNLQEGKYKLLHLPQRFGGAFMPKTQIIDMRKEKLKGDEFLSGSICRQLDKSLSLQQQSVIFLNRRGYAPLTLCRACGHRMQCPNCSAWLVMHKPGYRSQVTDHGNTSPVTCDPSPIKLSCHHCDYSRQLPNKCPACQEVDKLHPCGPGVERVAACLLYTSPSPRDH